MPESKLTETESLQIIEQMIGRARQEEKASGWGWILWGWLLFIASVSHYAMIKLGISGASRVWEYFGYAAIILILSSLVSWYFSRRKGRVKTYTNELVDKLGLAFFISLMVTSYGNNVTELNPTGANFGYLLLLYAFWMYIHGAAYRFNLLRYGAFVNWAGALVVFYFGAKLGAEVLLVHAICVALGYLIPGHIAQSRLSNKLHKSGHEQL